MFSMIQSMPYATAKISGNSLYPEIEGEVSFYEMYGGTLVVATVKNLPNGNGFHAFHIHDGAVANREEKVDITILPINRIRKDAGDMPPLLANQGTAFSAFYTDRFYPEDIVGKVVVIHAMSDDFKSQPSGNPGSMIACGEIKEKTHKYSDATSSSREN